MSVKIAGNVSNVDVEVDATSKAVRSTLYNSTGNEIGSAANPIRTLDTAIGTFIGRYSATTFRTLGLITQPHNIASFENPSGSGKVIAVERFTIQSIQNVATALLQPANVKTSRPAALPTGGTEIAAVKWDSNYTGATGKLRGATASDGGVATAITATPGTTLWQQYIQHFITAAGFEFSIDNLLLPETMNQYPYILRPGESLLVRLEVVSLAGIFYIVNCAWKEFTE